MDGSSVLLSALCGKGTLSMTDRTDSNVLEQRLSAIVDALEAENVAADENELWFEPKLGGGLQIRLGRELHARCYDRSTNFAISYGGHPATEPMSPAFRDALQRIKAIDDSPIDGAASAFPSAATPVADRFAPAPPVATAAVPLARPKVTALRSVVVVGGGTAGYFAALALKREVRNVDVTLIESSKIPIIGGGEATATLMPR